MTLEGTNTYVVGRDPAHVIDPGPAIPEHIEAVRAAGEERGGIAGILLTHSHADHAEAAELLDAPLLWGRVGGGKAGPSGSAVLPSPHPVEAGQDSPQDFGLTVLPSPGNARHHVCFVRKEVVFCGDLVLGWGSAIVPPASSGGSLADYMDSLDRLRALEPTLMCPGHGPWITAPRAKLDEYVAHRRERERKLVEALEAGERSREALLDAAWGDVPDAMRPAAAMAMEAHLEMLEGAGRLPEDLRP